MQVVIFVYKCRVCTFNSSICYIVFSRNFRSAINCLIHCVKAEKSRFVYNVEERFAWVNFYKLTGSQESINDWNRLPNIESDKNDRNYTHLWVLFLSLLITVCDVVLTWKLIYIEVCDVVVMRELIHIAVCDVAVTWEQIHIENLCEIRLPSFLLFISVVLHSNYVCNCHWFLSDPSWLANFSNEM